MEVEKRWCNGRGYVRCPHFYNSIKKYGWDNFDHIIILSNLSKEMALIVEENLIRKFNTTNQNFGYNCTTGGQAPRHSEETKEKLRRAKLGREMPDEIKEKISNTLKGEGVIGLESTYLMSINKS